MLKPLLLSLLLGVCACVGSDNAPAVDGAAHTDGTAQSTGDGGLGFGQPCTVVSNMSTECESGVCTNTIDQLGHPVCSQRCTMPRSQDPSCPSGSNGQFCNAQGYCKP